MNASYKSVSGRWTLNWRIEDDGKVTVHIEVPFNCTAKVILPRYSQGIFELEAGIFDITYEPDSDFRLMFTMESRLSELAASPEAVNILRRELPRAAAMIDSGDMESMNRSLSDLLKLSYMRFTKEEIFKAGNEICKLRCTY